MAEFLQKPSGKIVAGIIVVAGVLAAGYELFQLFGPSAGSQATKQVFVDSKTGTSFEHTLVAGEMVPVTAPSGGRTGYPAELCYWTPDGKPKEKPDYVLLNEATGAPGPTFCKVCHRLVVHHNPVPSEGRKAPPTEAEYQ